MHGGMIIIKCILEMRYDYSVWDPLLRDCCPLVCPCDTVVSTWFP
jgi:hypothetical protein